MNSEILKELERIGIDKLFRKLLVYSYVVLKQKGIAGLNFQQPADIAAGTIEYALTEGKWDKDTFGTIEEYLIHHCKNALRRVWRNKEFELRIDNKVFVEDQILYQEIDASQKMDVETQIGQMRRKIIDSKKSDDDLIELVFDAMLNEYKNSEISEVLEIDVSKVVNYKKRIVRCLQQFKNEQ